MEQKKAVYRGMSYQLLKRRNDGTNRWNCYGKRKSLKSIVDLIALRHDIDISEIEKDVREYKAKKSLSKVI